MLVGCSRRVKTIVTDMVTEEAGDMTATTAEEEDMVAEEETVTVTDGVAGVMVVDMAVDMAVDMGAAMVVGEGDTGTVAVAETEIFAAVVVGMEEVVGVMGAVMAVDTMVCFFFPL